MATAAELRKKFGIGTGTEPTPAPAPSAQKTLIGSKTPVTAELRERFKIQGPGEEELKSRDEKISATKPQETSILERGFSLLDKATGGTLSKIASNIPTPQETLQSLPKNLQAFVPFSGSLLKTQEDKVMERYEALKNAGIDEDRATQISIADTLPSLTRTKAIKELKVTKGEAKAMQSTQFFEGLDFALSFFGDVVPVGKGLFGLGKGTVKKLITETSEEAVKGILKNEAKASQAIIDEYAPRLAAASTEKEVSTLLKEAANAEASAQRASRIVNGFEEGASRSETAENILKRIDERGGTSAEDILKASKEAAEIVGKHADEVGDSASFIKRLNELEFSNVARGLDDIDPLVKQAGKFVDDLKARRTELVDMARAGDSLTDEAARKAAQEEFEDINKALVLLGEDSPVSIPKMRQGALSTRLLGDVGDVAGSSRQLGKLYDAVQVTRGGKTGAQLAEDEITAAIMARADELPFTPKEVEDALNFSKKTPEDFPSPEAYASAEARALQIENSAEFRKLADEVTSAGRPLPGTRQGDAALAPPDALPSSQGKIPGKEVLGKPGLEGLMNSSSSFSKRFDNEVEGSMKVRAEQELQPTQPRNPQNQNLFDRFRKGVSNSFNWMREQVQDDMLRVKQLVENKSVKVSDASDPYQAEILFHGRVGFRLEEAKALARDIDKDIVKSAGRLGIDDSAELTDEVNRYLIARHAPERNAALELDGAAGITTVEARAALREIEAGAHGAEVKRIADRVQEYNNQTLDILKEGEVISDELYTTLRTRYKNHIPLNRIFEGEEDIGAGLGKGFEVRSTGIKAAKGSKRAVADILENVVTNYEQAVIRAEKNRVDLATLKFVRDNQDTMGDLFKIVTPKPIGRTFGKDGEEGRIILETITDPQTLVMREKGKPVYLHIEDPNLAAALQGVGREKLSSLMRGVGAITRFYSGLQTRFNPEFAFANKVRDIQEVLVYAGAQGEMGGKGAAKVLGRELKLQNEGAVLDFITGKDSEGAKIYKQMREDGGTTGGLGLATRKQVELDMAEIRKLNRSNPRKAGAAIIEAVDRWNTIFEDSTRLSVYRQALEGGASRSKAARLAKESSVNFNKMGKAGPMINALYMFSNASIQGSAKMLIAMKNPRVAAATVLSVAAPVAAMNEWNDFVDPDWRDKVTTWDRLNGMPVMIPTADGQGVQYVTIPIGWGIKPIKVMADQISDLANGKSKGLVDASSAVMVSILEAYNPAGGTDVISGITPTVLDIPLELGRNQAWSGSKIRPDWDKYAPASIQYFDTLKDSITGQTAIAVSKGLSGIGMEVSPADLNYTFEQLIGGAGRTGKKVINTVAAAGQGKMPETRDIPILSRFYKQRSEEEVGAGTDEYDDLKAVLAEESREAFYLKQSAEDSYQQMKNLPPEEASKRWNELKEVDPDIAAKVADIAKQEKKNLNYTDRMILDLGVANGNRSKYLVEKFNELGTSEEKSKLWKELVDKGILTKEVQKQVNRLLTEPAPQP